MEIPRCGKQLSVCSSTGPSAGISVESCGPLTPAV